LDARLAGSQSWSGCGEEEKNSQLPTGNRTPERTTKKNLEGVAMFKNMGATITKRKLYIHMMKQKKNR
jgi:hypothetical protein